MKKAKAKNVDLKDRKRIRYTPVAWYYLFWYCRDTSIMLQDRNCGRELNKHAPFRYSTDAYSTYLAHAYMSEKEKDSLFMQASQPYLRLGQEYFGRADSSFGILKNSGTINDAYRTEINGVEFLFCKDANQRVDFISSSDTSFQTDSVKVGENFMGVTRTFQEVKVRHMRGWGHFIKLPGGWNAATSWEGGTDTVSKDARVQWFYKSR